jgi:hypothetical protein
VLWCSWHDTDDFSLGEEEAREAIKEMASKKGLREGLFVKKLATIGL